MASSFTTIRISAPDAAAEFCQPCMRKEAQDGNNFQVMASLVRVPNTYGISMHDFQRVTETSAENPRPPVPHGVLITGTQWRRSLETLFIARQLGLEPNTFTGTVVQSVLSSLVMSSYSGCCATATFVGIIKHVCQGCSLQDVDRGRAKEGQ